MASEPDRSETSPSPSPSPSSLFERFLSHRDISFLAPPFILDFTNSPPNPENPNPENPDQETSRIVLINPFTQGMVVIEGTFSLDSLLRHFAAAKGGAPPASRASIEAMPSAEIGEGEEGECVVCLEEWEIGGLVKEMPCKHRFHGDCVEKWLKIHGSCPICRFKMPAEKEEVGKNRDEIWVSIAFNGERISGDSNQIPSTDSIDSRNDQVEG